MGKRSGIKIPNNRKARDFTGFSLGIKRNDSHYFKSCGILEKID